MILVIAVSGLALTSAPDVAHFLPFLQPLMNTSKIAGGLAIVLVPAIVATIFFIIAVGVIHCEFYPVSFRPPAGN